MSDKPLAPVRRARGPRRGAAIAEFAVALPVIVALIFGMIQCGGALRTQHALGEAALAACRIYASPEGTKAQAVLAIEAAMQDAGVTGYTMEFDPSTKAGITSEMQPVTVGVSVETTEGFFAGKTIQAETVLPADLN